jgi:hypothetical protein
LIVHIASIVEAFLSKTYGKIQNFYYLEDEDLEFLFVDLIASKPEVFFIYPKKQTFQDSDNIEDLAQMLEEIAPSEDSD